MTATVSTITVYPIKSLDGMSVGSADILPLGSLAHDREFALYDEKGNCINSKSAPRLHSIRSEYDLEAFTIRLRSRSDKVWQTYHMVEEHSTLQNWFSNELGTAVSLRRDVSGGFPDDTFANGPTIISSGSISEIGRWFDISEADEIRRRFRTNVELSCSEPFWEDRLFGPPKSEICFKLGEVNIRGVGPCRRCPVPTRDSMTGLETPEFQKKFNSLRSEGLPNWSNRARFGPLFFRVAVNTKIDSSQTGKSLRVGDQLYF